jgi:hypothetical protein
MIDRFFHDKILFASDKNYINKIPLSLYFAGQQQAGQHRDGEQCDFQRDHREGRDCYQDDGQGCCCDHEGHWKFCGQWGR